MKTDKRVVWQNHTSLHKRTSLQPLAMGIASAVIITLILIMGIMDLRRSERSLTSFIENQGLAIAEVLQRLTQGNIDLLARVHQGEDEKSYAPFKDDALYPKTWLTTELSDLAKEVDTKWKADDLSEAGIKKFASEKGLWLVAVMNKQGKAVFQSRSLPSDFFPETDSSVKTPEITINLLSLLAQQKKIRGFIALQRSDGSGTVIIALDREGMTYWSLKVAVQKAIEKLGEGQKQGLVYMVVMNKKGMILGTAGSQPEKWKNDEILTYELFTGIRKIETRSVIYLKKNVLDIASPLYINEKISGIASDKIEGIIRIGLDKESTDIILKENKFNLIIFMIFVVLITLFAMWLLYNNQNKHLAGIVEMERRLQKAERLSALGQLAAGVAHEIRNPLNAISMASQRLKRDFIPSAEEKGPEFQLLSGVIRDEIRRLNGIIEEFLSFSKIRRLELHHYPASEILQKIVNLISTEAATKGIAIRTEWDDAPIIIPMDMDKLQQALLNFVKNAMESINGEGAITLSVAPKDKEHVVITISDTGCGMSAEEVERIFNPEYTTKEKGLGLGLPLAHEIIRGHGGEIRVSSLEGKGTTFEILLPVEKLSERQNGKAQKVKEAP